MGQIEQRLAARFKVEVSAEVYIPGEILAAVTRNLSTTGVCLDLKTGLKEGSTVGIALFFTSDGIEDPDTEPLNIKAHVIWCAQKDTESYSAGACFQELTEDNKRLLNDFLAALGG